MTRRGHRFNPGFGPFLFLSSTRGPCSTQTPAGDAGVERGSSQVRRQTFWRASDATTSFGLKESFKRVLQSSVLSLWRSVHALFERLNTDGGAVTLASAARHHRTPPLVSEGRDSKSTQGDKITEVLHIVLFSGNQPSHLDSTSTITSPALFATSTNSQTSGARCNSTLTSTTTIFSSFRDLPVLLVATALRSTTKIGRASCRERVS